MMVSVYAPAGPTTSEEVAREAISAAREAASALDKSFYELPKESTAYHV